MDTIGIDTKLVHCFSYYVSIVLILACNTDLTLLTKALSTKNTIITDF